MPARSFYAYYRLLISQQGKDELAKLLENLTVNETSFFRHKAQLDLFQKGILEELLKHKSARREYSIRVWSAGCSTGQEAYTLGMLVTDALAYYYLRNPVPIEMPLPKPLIPPPWRVEILASDISYSVLRHGQEGAYSENQMSMVDYGYRLRYFDKVADRYAVKKVAQGNGPLRLPQFENGVSAAAQRRDFLPQRDDVFRRGGAKAPDRKVLPLLESAWISVRGPRREPARPDREIPDGA